jgi:Fe-S-cluster containining protein
MYPEMNDLVAVITFEPKNRKIIELKLANNLFRFKCKRCAALCCKLGGPVLTRKDAKLIGAAGYPVTDFLEPKNGDAEGLPLVFGNLKTRADGSCVFLKFDAEQNCFQCGIYDIRPALCRLYPFSFESLGSNSVALKVIPCCMGLNNPDGEPSDENFVSFRILEPLLEAMELLKKGMLH